MAEKRRDILESMTDTAHALVYGDGDCSRLKKEIEYLRKVSEGATGDYKFKSGELIRCGERIIAHYENIPKD